MINAIKDRFNNKFIGVFAGVLSAINYAFYPALIAVLIYQGQTDNWQKIALGFAIVAAKESFTFFVSVILTPKVYFTGDMWKTFKTKWGWLSVLAGSFGGPIGYSLLTVASIFIGAATPDAINLGLVLIFTTLLERFLLKRKVNMMFIIGLMIVMFACIGLVAAQGLTIEDKKHFAIGFLFAIGAATAWSLENILADYVLTRNTVNLNSKNFLGIKLFSSAIIAIPLAIIVSYMTTKTAYGWHRYAEFYTNWKLGLSMIAVAVFIFGARIFYFISIKFATGKTTSALMTLQLIFAPILIIIVNSISGKGFQHDLDVIKTWWFWVLSLIILLGISITNLEMEQVKLIFSSLKKAEEDTTIETTEIKKQQIKNKTNKKSSTKKKIKKSE
ncbi:MAG: hypothetical protein HRT98_00385 [Mycoplasmatales bacterium]|nr:hypothetical protein [Mycoplasmatales bacterium]